MPRLTLLCQAEAVVGLKELPERRGVNQHNGILHQRLGAHQLVVGCIVHHVQHARLLGDTCAMKKIRAPRKPTE